MSARGALLAAVILVVLACNDGLREDELECEESVAHLAECCPGFESQKIRCDYSEGCNSRTYPSLALEESECIQKADCATLVASRVCERVQAAPQYKDDPDPTREITHAPVCP